MIMKRIFSILIMAVLLLTGCQRNATSSNWSPINSANIRTSQTVVPEELGISTTTPAPAETEALAASTEAAGGEIAPLDLSTLPEKLPDSMKGYELYSWQTGDDWNFTLITGTNRIKSFDEIIAAGSSVSSDGFVKISVRGLGDLEEVLRLLPAGENIVWGGMDLGAQVSQGTVYLTYPPQEIIDQVSAACSGLGLNLTTLIGQ